MRVVHLIGSVDPGGAETLAVEIAARERAAGHDHEIGHLGNAWLAEAARRRGVPEWLAPRRALYRSNATLPLFALGLARRLRRAAPDVVHAHLFGMAIAGAWAARLAGISCIATIHDRYYLLEKSHRGRLLARSGLRGRVVAVSDDVARTIAETSGLAARVIRNGVDTRAIRPDAQARRDVRRELGAGDDDIVLVTVGRLEPVKRHDLLLDAFARLCAERRAQRVHLWIAGDGSTRAATAARIAALAPDGAARLLGQRADVARLLAAADLFVLSSDSEGMPVALLEAMAAGLPCVARAVGGIPEVVVDGETGRLVAPDAGADPASPAAGAASAAAAGLAAAIADALAPARRRDWGAAARRRAEALFSVERMIDAYRALYDEAVKAHRSALDKEV
jgi:glycosyltransferase involved in cell wall biosynthesis